MAKAKRSLEAEARPENRVRISTAPVYGGGIEGILALKEEVASYA